MHSNTIFGFLVLAFFVHITSQGKLPKYMGFFVGAVKNAQGDNAPGAVSMANAAFPGLGPGVGAVTNGIAGAYKGISDQVSKWFGK